MTRGRENGDEDVGWWMGSLKKSAQAQQVLRQR